MTRKILSLASFVILELAISGQPTETRQQGTELPLQSTANRQQPTENHQTTTDTRQYILADPLRAAGNLHNYEPGDSTMTPAPAGYKPFYVSHIGRHGSRSHGDESTFDKLPLLSQFAEKGLLTDEGMEFYKTLRDIRSLNVDRGWGMLTEKGAREHRAIASRVIRRFPEVFGNPEKTNVKCYSTSVPRVIASMDNFAGAIEARRPDLKIHKVTSNDSPHARLETNYFKMTPEQRKIHESGHTTPFQDSLLSTINLNRLIAKTFKSSTAPEAIKGKEARFFYDLYLAGSNRQCFEDTNAGWIESYFTDDELFTFWKARNVTRVQSWTWTTENGGIKVLTTSSILRNIITDADAVISGADTCATFRFSHDGIILPLYCLLGLEGCDYTGSFRKGAERVCIAKQMPMGGNIEFVFFRNGSGKVLVKLLRNEEEVRIASLKPSKKGVYYDWDAFKGWCEGRMAPYFASSGIPTEGGPNE